MFLAIHPTTYRGGGLFAHGVLKGNIARWLFLAHPEIKQQLWGGHLWNPSYFVATVSERTEQQITDYINEQKTK